MPKSKCTMSPGCKAKEHQNTRCPEYGKSSGGGQGAFKGLLP